MIGRLVATTIAVSAFAVILSSAATPIPIMILDGESGGPYHDWRQVTPVLKKMLDETGLFATTVVTASATTDFSTFAPAWTEFGAVVMNYDAPDERWPVGAEGVLRRSTLAMAAGLWPCMRPIMRSPAGSPITR